MRDRATEQGEFFGILQGDGVGVGKGKPARVFDQCGVGEAAARRCVDDLAVTGVAFGWRARSTGAPRRQ